MQPLARIFYLGRISSLELLIVTNSKLSPFSFSSHYKIPFFRINPLPSFSIENITCLTMKAFLRLLNPTTLATICLLLSGAVHSHAADTAPTLAQLRQMLVGKTVEGVTVVSNTRFRSEDGTGNWKYTKTSPTTANLLITLDEYQNKPNIYREEYKLYFNDRFSGTWGLRIYYRGNLAWIEVGTFDYEDIVPAGQATPLTYSKGQTSTDKTPTLKWTQCTPEATLFSLVIYRNGKYYKSVPWQAAQKWTPDSDLPKGNYTWYVKTWKPGGVGPWSKPAKFNIPADFPGKAIALAYHQGLQTFVRRPTLSWTGTDPAAALYRVYVLRNGKYLMASPWQSERQWKPDNDLPQGNYTWYIQGWNRDGFGPWSDPARFNIAMQLPGKPDLTSYHDNTIAVDRTPTLTWNNDIPAADEYQVYLMRNGKYYASSDWVKPRQWTPTKNLPAGKFTWWVRGKNLDGNGQWAGPGKFTVQAQVPGASAALNFKDDFVTTDPTPGFWWTASNPAATLYYVYLIKDGQPYMASGWISNRFWTPNRTLPTGNYTWRIKTWNADGAGPWSNPATFRLVPPGGQP